MIPASVERMCREGVQADTALDEVKDTVDGTAYLCRAQDGLVEPFTEQAIRHQLSLFESVIMVAARMEGLTFSQARQAALAVALPTELEGR